MSNASQEIANKVRGIAAEKRFTQERIAAILGLARSSVSQRYSGATPFTAPELYILATAFDIDISRFFPERVAS